MLTGKKSITIRYFLYALAIVAVTACGCYWYFLHSFSLKIIVREVTLPAGYESLNGKKLIFFSDLHAIDAADDQRHFLQEIRIINSEEPDFIFFGGDLAATDNFEHSLSPSRVVSRFRQLQAKYGVYAITGNHDWYSGHGMEFIREMKQMGIHVLDNDSMTIPGLCNIVGVQDEDGPEGVDVKKTLKNIEPNLPTLALIHRPEYWERFPESVKLFFAGHTHGGQIRLPLILPLLLKHIHAEQYGGHEYKKENGQQLFITYGIGTSWCRVRINCPSEIIIFKFKPESVKKP